MRNNHFSLTAPLRVREATRDEARLRFAEAINTLHELERLRTATLAEISEVDERRRAALAPGLMSAPRLSQLAQYRTLLERQMASLAQQATAAEQIVDERRRALAEAERDVKQLEKLRDSREERHRAEEQLRESRRDELSTRSSASGRPSWG